MADLVLCVVLKRDITLGIATFILSATGPTFLTLENNIRKSLLALPRGAKQAVVALADICLVVSSVWLAYYLRIGEFIHLTRWTDEHFPLPAVAIGLLIIPLFSVFGMYKLVFRYAGVQTMISSSRR